MDAAVKSNLVRIGILFVISLFISRTCESTYAETSLAPTPVRVISPTLPLIPSVMLLQRPNFPMGSCPYYHNPDST